MGAIIRHGPHHGAQASSSTGSAERSTWAANVASLTVTGAVVPVAPTGSGVLHRPHTGWRPASALRFGTWLVAPQLGQRMSRGGPQDVSAHPPTQCGRAGFYDLPHFYKAFRGRLRTSPAHLSCPLLPVGESGAYFRGVKHA